MTRAYGAEWTYDYGSRGLEVAFTLEQDPEPLRNSKILAPLNPPPGVRIHLTDRWQALVRATLPTSDVGKQQLTSGGARVTGMLALILAQHGFIVRPTMEPLRAVELSDGTLPPRSAAG